MSYRSIYDLNLIPSNSCHMYFHSLILLQLLASILLYTPPAPRFEAQTIDDKVTIGYGLAIGDVDGDKKPDILLADKKQFVWYRNGDWKRFVLVDSLTQHDNVCIAARDIDGDGSVEVAVGAQWNPGETSDAAQSGSVHYLVRPNDPTQLWQPIRLHHEPTVHRMQWVQGPNGQFALVVLPLHGRGNKGGEGAGVRMLAYRIPKDVNSKWAIDTLNNAMHLTHNFDVVPGNAGERIYLAGKEGVQVIDGLKAGKGAGASWPQGTRGMGEVRVGKDGLVAAIEPMHGDELVVYSDAGKQRTSLDSKIKEGHALAIADLDGDGSEDIVAGWRLPNRDGKVGIKWYQPAKDRQGQWTATWIDDNGMACEDLKVADLNGDGKPDIIASGRATHNLTIYWNR